MFSFSIHTFLISLLLLIEIRICPERLRNRFSVTRELSYLSKNQNTAPPGKVNQKNPTLHRNLIYRNTLDSRLSGKHGLVYHFYDDKYNDRGCDTNPGEVRGASLHLQDVY